MAYIYEDVDGVEPVSDSFGEAVGNQHLYGWLSGCAVTYSLSDMTVDLAAGQILFNGAPVTVATATGAWTIVADGTNPRWSWLALDNTGAPVLVSGTAAAQPTVPELGDRVAVALVLVPANETIADNITYKLDKRVPTHPEPLSTAMVVTKYKTADQAFTTNTTFADISASSGTFSFDILPDEVWVAQYVIPITFLNSTVTGGVKLQLTGPANVAKVMFGGTVYRVIDGVSVRAMDLLAPATAFSATIGAGNSSNGGAGPYHTSDPPTFFLDLLVVNGSTAGTVTLQGAQNSSNGTTNFAENCWMTARRVA